MTGLLKFVFLAAFFAIPAGAGAKDALPDTLLFNGVERDGLPLLLLYIGLTALLVTLLHLLPAMRRRRRAHAVFRLLPVRVAVCDADGRFMFHQSSESDPWDRRIHSLRDLPDPLPELFLESIRETLKRDEPFVRLYQWEGRRRRAKFQKLPSSIFGRETVVWVSTDVEELFRERVEKEKLSDRFRLTLQSIADGVIATDESGRVTLTNPVAERLTGLDAVHMNGMPVAEAFRCLDKGTSAPMVPPAISVLEQKVFSDEEVLLESADGTKRIVAVSASPIMGQTKDAAGAVMVFRDVSRFYENVRRREEITRRLETIVNSLPCALWIKEHGEQDRYVSVNRYFCNFTGIPEERFVKRTDYELFPPDLARKYTEDDLALLREKHDMEFFEDFFSSEGKRRTFRVKKCVVPAPDGSLQILGIGFDITELMENRSRLTEANAILQGLLDNLPPVVMAQDSGDFFRFVMWNKDAETVSGIPASAILGKTASETPLPPAMVKRVTSMFYAAASAKKGVIRQMTVFPGMDGTMRHFYSFLTKVAAGGRSLLLCVSLDVTEEKRLDAERKKLTAGLQLYAEQERMFNTCLQSVIFTEDDVSAMQSVLETIGMYMQCDSCHLVHFGTDNIARSGGSWRKNGSTVKNPDIPIRPDSPALARLAAEKRLIVENVREYPLDEEFGAFAQFYRKAGVRSVFNAGVFSGGRLGACLAFLYTGEMRSFRKRDAAGLSAAVHIMEVILARMRHCAERNRIETERNLLLDTVRIPILLFDRRQRLVRVNNAAMKITEYTEQEVYAQDCNKSFCHFPERPADCPVKLALLDGKTHEKELQLGGRDYLLNAYPVTRDGEIIYILKTLVDVTASNQVQKELTRALYDAQNADKAKSFFLATISHELRTPLNAIIGFSELLQNSEVSAPDRAEYLQSIHLSGNALLNLVNDVLDLSRIESEQLTLVPQSTDIAALLHEIHAIFRHRAEEKHLEFRLSCPEDLPLIRLDALRFRQILLNLTGNAVKFTTSGYIAISVSFTKKTPGTCDLEVAVEDTGRGIHPDYKEKVFLPFIQQDSGRDAENHGKGTGLGLAVSRRLAVRMGGSLGIVRTEPGKGSVFLFSLRGVPFVSRAPASVLPEKVFHFEQIPDILIVDDVPMNLRVFAAILKKMGVTVRTAESSRTALEEISRKVPDYLFTDMWMPGMDGALLSVEIRKLPEGKDVVIAAVTADTGASGNFDMSGIDDVLYKPVTLKKMSHFFEKHPPKK